MFKAFTTALLVLVVAVAAGCGSSDDGGSSDTIATSSLSRAAYVKQVNEICERGRGELSLKFAAYAKEQGSQDNLVAPKLAPGIVTVLVPAIRAQDEEIEELGAPEGDEAAVEAFLAAREQVLASAEQSPPKSIFDFGDSFRESPNKMAKKYGIESCVY